LDALIGYYFLKDLLNSYRLAGQSLADFRKKLLPLIIVIVLVFAAWLPLLFTNNGNDSANLGSDVFVGVTFGSNSVNEAKALIDKVKGYTNLFVVDSWDVSTNETALTEICDYAVDANLSVMVYFDFIYYNLTRTIGSIYNASTWEDYGVSPWHIPWLNNTEKRWGDKFLGVYLYDEPGGTQIDSGYWGGNNVTRTGSPIRTFENVSDYADAANRFVSSLNRSRSLQLLTNASYPDGVQSVMPIFTSDYALYWFDYEAGYDVVFAEISAKWGASRNLQQIALCRGAAKAHDKRWGTIVAMASDKPPYLESGDDMLQDMITAYDAGADYVLVFNFPPVNEYGALTDNHFAALEDFWNHFHTYPRKEMKAEDHVAFVLPKDYGWGMRNPEDKIWGFWPADELSPVIWNRVTQLTNEKGLKLDIVYDDSKFSFQQKYSTIYYWNGTTG
jgi:hypothetical protein